MTLSHILPNGTKQRKLIIFWFVLANIVCVAYLKKLNDISCYNKVKGNVLKSVDEKSFSPPEKSIYFHETSCKGGLNLRQACSIESAARTHRRWHINVIFSAPIGKKALKRGTLRLLKSFKNVKFLRLHLLKSVKNTPVEKLVLSGALNRSKFRVSHTSDLLRFLTLYKWGGIYLDLDMIVGKSLEPLGKNWVALESDKSIGSGVLAFSRDVYGRKLANASIMDFADNYNGSNWANNGPGVITRVLKKVISIADVKGMAAIKSKGFKVYNMMFMSYKNASEYFKPGHINFKDSYMYHIWNSFTSKMTTKCVKSRYIQLAKKLCPLIYNVYGIKIASKQVEEIK